MNYIEVKIWMLREGLEIKEVAAAAGVSPTTITLTLQNKRFRSYLKVRKALRKFGCPTEWLGKAKKKGSGTRGQGPGASVIKDNKATG